MLNPRQALLAKLADRSARLGVVGLGYVGLPLALRYAQVGYPVLGFDIDAAKIESLAQGRSYIAHVRMAGPLAATTSAHESFATMRAADT